jgi:hypothetical protein
MTFRDFLDRLVQRTGPTIDVFFSNQVGMDLTRFRASAKELPGFRFVDLYLAAEWFSDEHEQIAEIQSEHEQFDLSTLMHSPSNRRVWKGIKQSRMLGWAVGPEQERYFPVDKHWVTGGARPPAGRLIVRLSYNQFYQRVRLEVAAVSPQDAAAAIDAICARSVSHSIYRGSVLELAFVAGTKDEYGDIEKPQELRVLFKSFEPVAEEDIVIDDEVRSMLIRNIIDLQERRDILKANGVPIRRGVLLYGPPGTGKTFACRYVFARLPGVTRIAVAGTALMQVGHIFSLARLYQPSLVVLEDVDLVFASREINLYSSILGELLDQMDGLRPSEDIGVLLTTNSIERMEAAIKDRPGRIGQCIYFGPPQRELRRRYLAHYLGGYDTGDVNIDELVAQSEDATQAFLKEWVHRAVQIATERLSGGDTRAKLRTADFVGALSEMKRFTQGSTGRIIGFIRGG